MPASCCQRLGVDTDRVYVSGLTPPKLAAMSLLMVEAVHAPTALQSKVGMLLYACNCANLRGGSICGLLSKPYVVLQQKVSC